MLRLMQGTTDIPHTNLEFYKLYRTIQKCLKYKSGTSLTFSNFPYFQYGKPIQKLGSPTLIFFRAMFPSLDTNQLNPYSEVLHRVSCLLAFTCLAWPTEIVISTYLKHSLNLQKDLCNKFLQTMHMVYKVKLLHFINYKSWRTIQIHNNRNYNIALTRILWFWRDFYISVLGILLPSPSSCIWYCLFFFRHLQN